MCYSYRNTNDEETTNILNKYKIDLNEYISLSNDTFGTLLDENSQLNSLNNNLK